MADSALNTSSPSDLVDPIVTAALRWAQQGHLSVAELLRHLNMRIQACKARASHTGLCCRTLEEMIAKLEGM